ncbi:hypothetical protein [Thalassomonas actiniarum]|uniref:Uncharacterized protein n=1 Tax=Thalassomonas actiniarum TaxID=485447 RepID=A0AAE9YSB2_9GAMM|nr:hypothetical protein [Thalassomonas actiniarum]WDD99374.1 hypothetical protein SG35_001400 [Thalassomonas actiniarum]
MKKAFYRPFTLMLGLLLPPAIVSAQETEGLPPILEYYPDCAYQVVKTFSAKKQTRHQHSQEHLDWILKRLRREAQEAGADALILTDKKVQQAGHQAVNHGRKQFPFSVAIKAELIRNCESKGSGELTATKIDGEGRRRLSTKLQTVKMEKKSMQFSFAQKRLNHPKILNSGISLSGVYGVNIGSSYQQVRELFGDPSVELRAHQDEVVLGYGRRHWLHFQSGRLVKVQSDSPLLSTEVLNEIPLRDFFDDFAWKLEDKAGYKAPLRQVKESLKITGSLDKKNQLTIRGESNTLILDFLSNKNGQTSAKSYSLKGFALQENGYRAQASGLLEQQQGQYQAIADIYAKLKQAQEPEPEISWHWLSTRLGEPAGSIILSVDSRLNIYNQHLLVTIKDLELTSVAFIEQAFLSDKLGKNQVKPWHLGSFKQGARLEQLRAYFPDDAFELGDEVEITADNYSLSLLFSELDGEPALYEAKMKLY